MARTRRSEPRGSGQARCSHHPAASGCRRPTLQMESPTGDLHPVTCVLSYHLCAWGPTLIVDTSRSPTRWALMNPRPVSAAAPDPPNDGLLRVRNLEVVGPGRGSRTGHPHLQARPHRAGAQKPTAVTATAFKLSKACYR